MNALVPRTGRGLRILIGVVTAAGVCAGCAGGLPDAKTAVNALDVREKLGWNAEQELPPPQIPSRLVATWLHAVRHTPGQPSKRGFGGRIVFFGHDMNEPVRVEGQLVVYAFDEEGRQEYETQPTRRYIFPPDQFAKHEGESKLGPSYSVWIPWDEVGGPQKNISLITRFEPAGGSIVVGEQTRHLLPGTQQQLADVPTPSAMDRSIRLAGYDEEESAGDGVVQAGGPAGESLPEKRSAASATIDLPDNLRQRLQKLRARRAKLNEVQQTLPTADSNPSAQSESSTSVVKTQTVTQRVVETESPSAIDDAAKQPAEDAQQAAVSPRSVGRYVQGAPARGLPSGAIHSQAR